MLDFWLAVLWTSLIAAGTMVVDWIAGYIVGANAGLRGIQQAVDQATTNARRVKDVFAELHKVQVRDAVRLLWGVELANVALSLDLSILGLWVTNPMMFPFFSRWNTIGSSRELGIWLILFSSHFLFLLLTIICKHRHGLCIESVELGKLASPFSRNGLRQYKWMFLGNSLGFLVLLTTFIAMGNSLW